MLLLDSKQWEIDGISVFPDHADPQQYYYLPLMPHLTTVKDPKADNAEIPQFSLIRFRGRAGTGGFLNFDVNIGAGQKQLDKIAQQIQQEQKLRSLPNVAPVTTIDGTVRLLMLGKQSGDNKTPAATIEGPQFVLKMDHSAKPSLYGSNQASFSVRLDAAGVTVIEKSLEGEILPIAVVYSLDYLGLRPAYSVNLSIDWDRVQSHMDEITSKKSLFSTTEIFKGVDELIEKRVIVINTDGFFPENEENRSVNARRDAAINQVRAMVTDAFFEPSLPPMEAGKEKEWSEALRAASGVVGAICMGPLSLLASSVNFSYRKTECQRIDRKSLNVNFSERVTVQRSIHPQGHLAGMFRLLQDTPLPLSHFVIDVDLDDPWFERRRLNVVSRADFDMDSIGSINVKARYGVEPKNILLSKTVQNGDFEWMSVIENGVMRRPVDLRYEVTFAGVNAAERPRNLISEPFQCEVENLEIDPRELYTVSSVPIVAVNFPFDTYHMVEVHVRYRDEPSGLDEKDTFRLTKQKQDAVWRMFILDINKRDFSYRLVYRAANNRDIDTGWRTAEDEQITVRDPFPRKRILAVIANVDWDQVEWAYVDLRYEDKANGILEEASFTFSQGSAPQQFAADMLDPELKQVYFKATFLYKDGRMAVVPESMTMDQRIFVRPDMKGNKIIEVRPPADFSARKFKRVTVDIRYEDFAAGLSYNASFVFVDAAARGYFGFDYVNEAHDRYEACATFVYQNGLVQSTDWTASNTAVLQIKAP